MLPRFSDNLRKLWMPQNIFCILIRPILLEIRTHELVVVDVYTNRKLQWLPLTGAVKGFFLQLKPAVWWTSIKPYHGFHALDKKRFFPCFSSTQRKMSAFKWFLQYFATGSDTISSQDYEGYECVKSLSEETQIIMDLFTHCKAYSIRSQLVWVLASSDFYLITWKW